MAHKSIVRNHLLYGLTLFFGAALVATFLAGGAAMVIGAVVGA